MATTIAKNNSSSSNSTENPLTFNPEGDLIFSEFIGTDSVGKCTLTLSRSSACDEKSTVIYRIQTTNPSLYRVRPSVGILDPKTPFVEVDLTMASYPAKKDKFQVRSLLVTEELSFPADADNGDEVLKAFSKAQSQGVPVSDHKMLVIAPPKPEEPVAVEEKENAVPDLQTSEGAAAAPQVPTAAAEQQVPAESKKEETGKTPIKEDASEMATLRAELQEAKAKIQILVAKNQELTTAVSTAQQQVRSRGTAPTDEGVSESERLQHPATELPAGLTQAELEEMIRNQAGFPPMLVLLIALFAFLVGLLF